jgi:phosphatidylserine decarboxylase
MTPSIRVIDRTSQKAIPEDVWGEFGLRFLYGQSFCSKTVGRTLLHTFFRWPIVSWAAGLYYDSHHSCRLIKPFCDRFSIDMKESQLEIEDFTSFNDFFTRRLRPECRPQDLSPNTLTAPADGRYTLLENLGSTRSIHVKGEALSLSQLLGSSHLAARFYGGSGVICRLCPADCHRFYFPVSAHANEPTWINGSLFSVNPIATQTYPWIFWRNRRIVTLLDTDGFGSIAYLEIGATNCGSITQTFVQNSWVRKGEEKGFFKLGGSAIVLLFEPGQLRFANDLQELSKSGLEILCRTGQPLAHAS